MLLFSAEWAPPCEQFLKSLSHQLMKDAMPDATVIVLEYEDNGTGQAVTGEFDVRAFPTFIRVDSQLQEVKRITGNAWKENTPGNMAPVMKAFMK